jgi:antitoxin component HigA of HigAB toxin-antitoxin module
MKEHLPSIVDALKFRMDRYGHSQAQACRVMKIPHSHFNEVLKRKRKPTFSQIRKFYQYGIPPKVLLQ